MRRWKLCSCLPPRHHGGNLYRDRNWHFRLDHGHGHGRNYSAISAPPFAFPPRKDGDDEFSAH